MNRDELIDKLKRIDENIYFSNKVSAEMRADIVIVGASALLLCDLSHKAVTKDVDVLDVENSIREIVLSDKDFNTQCATFVQCLPYNYEDRLQKLDLGTYVLDVWVPSVEDIAVMKLYRFERPDKIDLCSDEFLKALDWDMLDYLVHSPDEAAASRITTPDKDLQLQNLLANYCEYEHRWRR